MVSEIPLAGGVAHPGAVVRIGDTVRRPTGGHTESVHALLEHVRAAGFEGVPRPLGTDERGREVLAYLPGDVPVPPYPAWALRDETLASVARLLRRYHEAVAGFDPGGRSWSTELADPGGGPIAAHNDVCPENVVFRDGEAVGLLDFDSVAPGRTLGDV